MMLQSLKHVAILSATLATLYVQGLIINSNFIMKTELIEALLTNGWVWIVLVGVSTPLLVSAFVLGRYLSKFWDNLIYKIRSKK